MHNEDLNIADSSNGKCFETPCPTSTEIIDDCAQKKCELENIEDDCGAGECKEMGMAAEDTADGSRHSKTVQFSSEPSEIIPDVQQEASWSNDMQPDVCKISPSQLVSEDAMQSDNGTELIDCYYQFFIFRKQNVNGFACCVHSHWKLLLIKYYFNVFFEYKNVLY